MVMAVIASSAIVPRAVPYVIPSSVPSAVPTTVPSAVVPRIPIPRVAPAPGIAVVPRVVVPRRVPPAVVPRVGSPVDGTVERTVPVPVGRAVPRLVGAPSVEPVVEKIYRGGVVGVVEIYSCRLVLRYEQSIDFLSAFHKDRGVFGLRHQKIRLLFVLRGSLVFGLCDL